MREISSGDGSYKQAAERWHIKMILEAIERKDIAGMLTELSRAIISEVKVGESDITVKDEINFFSEGIYDSIGTFISNTIKEGDLSPEERIRYYRFFRQYDHEIASIFIERQESDNDIQELSLTSPEIQRAQVEHYEWLVDKGEDVFYLYDILMNDGHLDDTAPYELDSVLKKKIVSYVKKESLKAKVDPQSEEYAPFSEIIESLDEDR